MTERQTPRPTGTSSEQFTEQPSDEDAERIEAERQDRLAPENRPENAEVDNTGRTFDTEAGMFTDAEGYDELSEEDKPYDDTAGETGTVRSVRGPDDEPGTESAEEPAIE
ncbi:hypothetical protein [Nocardioides terrisoli]|uniref:hypothetical protein n=1 Tax=Nocardioides terrisoli TaxID=3388267 RepID=UPI00287B7941|nr:hypothetical protein [Nocardioides marmorisolisilvae]